MQTRFHSITFFLTTLIAVVTMIILVAVIMIVERSITHHFEIQDESQLQALANTVINNQHHMQQKMTARVINQSLGMHQNVFAYTITFDQEAKAKPNQVKQESNHERHQSPFMTLNPYVVEVPDAEIDAIENTIYTFLRDAQPLDVNLLNMSTRNTITPIIIKSANYNTQLHDWQINDVDYRVLISWTENIQTTSQQKNHAHFDVMVIGIDIDFHHQYLTALRHKLFLISLFTSILITLLSFFIIKRGLSPITHFNQVINHIATGKLKTRIDSKPYPTELKPLIDSFNLMMKQIDELFEKQKQFSADIAHELRTPMTNLITQTQIILQKSRETPEYEEVLYENLEEFERLSKMINDMLFLARSDNDQNLPNLAIFNLANSVHEVIDYFEALSESESIQITLDCYPLPNTQFLVEGHEPMLKRAISNILENAICYASPESTITIQLKIENNHISLTMTNQIISEISSDRLEQIFDRFYRLDPARTQNKSQQGFGIGLSITQAIIKAHQGNIYASSEQKTFTMHITLPQKQ